MTKIFFLPHAGADARYYNEWARELNSETSAVISIEYKGHGNRQGCGFYKDFYEMCLEIYHYIKDKLNDGDDYIVYGHSMGASVAFEVERMLEENSNRKARGIFLSGREAPNRWNLDINKISNLDNDEFIEKIQKYEVDTDFYKTELGKKEYLPMLKNDFRLMEEMHYDDKEVKIDADIIVMAGILDEIKIDGINEWKTYTSGKCNVRFLNGGHFFIKNNRIKLIEYIRNYIL